MGIWVVDTLTQLLVKGSYTGTKIKKDKLLSCKTPFFAIRPFCLP